MSTQAKGESPKPRFFATPARFRAWLERHHADAPELWVGYYKTASGRPSITWPQSVDEALCFGWIDGLRKTIDETSYKIRFTPRRPGSIWSAVNIARAKELRKLGRMAEAGLRAFDKRSPEKSAIDSYEQRQHAALDTAQTKLFRANPQAWAFFSAQPPGYRRIAAFWIVSAKKEETRARRLAALIAESAASRRIGLTPPPSLERPQNVTRSVSGAPAKPRRGRHV